MNKINSAAEKLKVIGHPMRIKITLRLQEAGSMSVTQIIQSFGIEQAIASHHLNILKNKGVLKSNRLGKNTFYDLSSPKIYEAVQLIVNLK
ncbi:MAG: metalloregulator ArsR/SmtB family transcription factor [Flavobacteriales bacterium]|nr:metalloregulator ArsR/SmtB family transcription factor [Flavobacteriales bacterium]